MSVHEQLQAFITKLQQEYNKQMGGEQPPEVSVLVSDTTYYRTFELLDFYEFSEHLNMEPGTVNFDITVTCGDWPPYYFRLMSSPGHAYIGLLRIESWSPELKLFIPELLDILIPSLNLKICHLTGFLAADLRKEFSTWAELQSHKTSQGMLFVYGKTF